MTIAQLFGHDDSIVDEANFETVFGGLHEGVFVGVNNECRVVASAVPAMTVEVRTGTFITGGVFAQVSAQEVLVVTVADAVNPRIDRVICRRNNATDTVTVVMLDGVTAGAPTPPALTRAGDIYEISLAQVYVAALAASITREDIKDEREDCDLCGYVSGRSCRQQDREQIEGLLQEGLWTAYGDATLLASHGLWEGAVSQDTGSAALADVDGIGLRQNTGGILGDEAYSESSGVHRRQDWHTIVEFKFKILDDTSIRLFVGLVSLGGTIPVSSDDPGIIHCAGLQFSTDRGDTTWQFVTKDGAVQTLEDTEVAADTDAHYLRVSLESNELDVIIELFDADHNIQSSMVFNAASGDNIPGIATTLIAYSGVETRVGAARNIVQYVARGINRGV